MFADLTPLNTSEAATSAHESSALELMSNDLSWSGHTLRC